MPLENPDSAGSSLLSRARKALRGAETGAPVIGRHAKTAPAGPGVYRMIDAAGEVLYVGKARHLKKRVQSYARGAGHNNRIARMIADTASMEFVTTATEIEALLLEANLIKRLKPRFNVVLRDDKSFPFILIARDHLVPQILKHRGARNRQGDYFGPFASAGAVGRTINTLQRAFLLRSCSDAYYESRVRPCLLFQIKRCSAPCTGEISVEDYGALVDEALRFLTGESDEVKRRLHALMDEASLKQDYERAASFRDRLTALIPRPVAPGHQSAQREGSRRVRRPSGGRPDLHPGVLLSHRQQLGQPRLFSACRQERAGGGGARVLHRSVL